MFNIYNTKHYTVLTRGGSFWWKGTLSMSQTKCVMMSSNFGSPIPALSTGSCVFSNCISGCFLFQRNLLHKWPNCLKYVTGIFNWRDWRRWINLGIPLIFKTFTFLHRDKDVYLSISHYFLQQWFNILLHYFICCMGVKDAQVFDALWRPLKGSGLKLIFGAKCSQR